MFHRTLTFVALAFSLLMFSSTASAQQVIGLGASLHADDGVYEDRVRVDQISESEDSYAFQSESSLLGGIWYLRHANEHVRWGGGIRYFGSYGLIDEEDAEEFDPEEDEELEAYELGRLAQLYAAAEWVIPMADELSLLLGAQIGPSLLFPGDDLEEDIEELEDEDVGVWKTPRFGTHFGPHVGAVYQLTDLVSLRADATMRHESLPLFGVNDEVDDVRYEKSTTTTTLRYEFGFAVEVALGDD
ncbi:MAG: hypothetical protein ACOCV2_04210 [Persicimonas sp.]